MKEPLHTPGLSDLAYLLPQTKTTLLALSDISFIDSFTFVGGSGLSLYLHHRLSEDIDLFSWENRLDLEMMIPRLQKQFKNIVIEQSGDKQLDLKLNNVKVTFFANGWEELKDRKPFHKYLNLASLSLLAGMKLNTLFLRAKFRDYYDLYALSKTAYTITELYDIIDSMMPGMNRRLFQMALSYVEDVEEDQIHHLSPKYKVNLETIRLHFEKEIRQWLKA